MNSKISDLINQQYFLKKTIFNILSKISFSLNIGRTAIFNF
jgi:hypothetical protein